MIMMSLFLVLVDTDVQTRTQTQNSLTMHDMQGQYRERGRTSQCVGEELELEGPPSESSRSVQCEGESCVCVGGYCHSMIASARWARRSRSGGGQFDHLK